MRFLVDFVVDFFLLLFLLFLLFFFVVGFRRNHIWCYISDAARLLKWLKYKLMQSCGEWYVNIELLCASQRPLCHREHRAHSFHFHCHSCHVLCTCAANARISRSEKKKSKEMQINWLLYELITCGDFDLNEECVSSKLFSWWCSVSSVLVFFYFYFYFVRVFTCLRLAHDVVLLRWWWYPTETFAQAHAHALAQATGDQIFMFSHYFVVGSKIHRMKDNNNEENATTSYAYIYSKYASFSFCRKRRRTYHYRVFAFFFLFDAVVVVVVVVLIEFQWLWDVLINWNVHNRHSIIRKNKKRIFRAARAWLKSMRTACSKCMRYTNEWTCRRMQPTNNDLRI